MQKTAIAPRTELIYRHALIVRLTHWINVLCLLVLLMSSELMLNSVNLTLVAYNRLRPMNHAGQNLAFFVIAVAAAEAAVGLAIVLAFFRVRKTIHSDEANLLKN